MIPDFPAPTKVSPSGYNAKNLELRGYEVARYNPILDTWEKVMTCRPTERGYLEARESARWLNQRAADRKTDTLYECRPVVSFRPEEVAGVNPDAGTVTAPPPAFDPGIQSMSTLPEVP